MRYEPYYYIKNIELTITKNEQNGQKREKKRGMIYLNQNNLIFFKKVIDKKKGVCYNMRGQNK